MSTPIKQAVRVLRKEQTASEKVFWNLVRDRRLEGKKFLRQYAIKYPYLGKKRFFVADFYCAELKLVVEIDEKIHESQELYDLERTFIINKLGIRVVRFKNEELTNASSVIEKLKQYL